MIFFSFLGGWGKEEIQFKTEHISKNHLYHDTRICVLLFRVKFETANPYTGMISILLFFLLIFKEPLHCKSVTMILENINWMCSKHWKAQGLCCNLTKWLGAKREKNLHAQCTARRIIFTCLMSFSTAKMLCNNGWTWNWERRQDCWTRFVILTCRLARISWSFSSVPHKTGTHIIYSTLSD